MSNQEFETTRTALANEFAEAGAKLLAYQPLVSTAVAAIPDTQPQKYAVAGTLPGILQMAGKMMGEEGTEQPNGMALGTVFKGADGLRKLADATEFWEHQPYGTRLYFGDGIADYLHRDVLRAAVAYLSRQSAAETPTGDLTEKVRRAMIRAYGLGQTWWQQADSEYASENKKADVTAARFIELNDDLCAAIAARQSQQAEKRVPDDVRRALDRMCTPLDESRLSGATAQEDARCMQIIKQFIEGTSPSSQEGAHAARNAVRNQVLEEAAKVCDSLGGGIDMDNVDEVKLCANSLARAIRAMKTQADTERSHDE